MEIDVRDMELIAKCFRHAKRKLDPEELSWMRGLLHRMRDVQSEGSAVEHLPPVVCLKHNLLALDAQMTAVTKEYPHDLDPDVVASCISLMFIASAGVTLSSFDALGIGEEVKDVPFAHYLYPQCQRLVSFCKEEEF